MKKYVTCANAASVSLLTAILTAAILIATLSFTACATTGSATSAPKPTKESALAEINKKLAADQGVPTDIFDAIRKKNVDALNAFIAQGVDVNATVVTDAEYGSTATPLIYVLEMSPGFREDNIPESTRALMVEALLKAGANPNGKDNSGWNAWTYALRCGWTSGKVERMLIDAGVDIFPVKEADGIVGDTTGTAKSIFMADYPDRPNIEGLKIMVEKCAETRVAAEEVLLITKGRYDSHKYQYSDENKAKDIGAMWDVFKTIAHRCFVAEAAKPIKPKAANKGAIINVNAPLLYSIAYNANYIPDDVLKAVLDDAVATGVDFGIKDDKDFTAFDRLPSMPTKYSTTEEQIAGISLPAKYQIFLDANRRAKKPCPEGETIIGLRLKRASN